MKIKSISMKTFFVFLSFILVIISIAWILQTYFLEEYYVHKKIETMKTHVAEIEASMDKMSSEKIQSYIQDIAEKNGARVMILSNEGELLYYSRQQGFNKGMMVGIEIWERLKAEEIVTATINSGMGQGKNSHIEWILYGKLSSQGMGIIMETPLESIEETVDITRQFYIYIFTIAILFSMVLALIFSRMVTKPLIKLNDQVKKMGNLNFDGRCDEEREDEIGQLGKTFNFLMEKLDKTIGALKIELEKEKNMERMRKQFIAQVSHELQTPISIIQGYAEGLKDGMTEDQEETDFYCDVIHEETHKLSRMVKDLLDLSQLESGTFGVNLEPFKFSDLVEGIVAKYRPIVKEKHIKISLDNPYDEIITMGDENRIEQLMINFIQNAVNHTMEYGQINILLEKREHLLRVGVQNFGETIPEDEIPLIWNSFYKGKNNGEIRGTGLGLAISKSILQLHHSDFGVRNLTDGVEFFFTLETS